jgi:LmbE family N-acetylglucosaminyl deacetylase
LRKNNRILVVAAHPDDEIIGAGGTIARLTKEGYETHVLILGEGITSRFEKMPNANELLTKLKQQAEKAKEIIGVKEIYFYSFPDNKFDSVPLLEIVKSIEKIKDKIQPSIVFTHFREDLNIDHQITYKAVLAAFRPLCGCETKEIYSFEVLSSTEWAYPTKFSPNVFFDISETLDLKIRAMKQYTDELREFPHPRSIEGIRLNAQVWGMKVGLRYAEAFELVRMIR